MPKIDTSAYLKWPQPVLYSNTHRTAGTVPATLGGHPIKPGTPLESDSWVIRAEEAKANQAFHEAEARRAAFMRTGAHDAMPNAEPNAHEAGRIRAELALSVVAREKGLQGASVGRFRRAALELTPRHETKDALADALRGILREEADATQSVRDATKALRAFEKQAPAPGPEGVIAHANERRRVQDELKEATGRLEELRSRWART